jgi:protein farnesyltransferase/geranylgeranyltransferase type-1 subunit alpha
MAPKNKGAAKAKTTECKSTLHRSQWPCPRIDAPPPDRPPEPHTVLERSQQAYEATNPLEAAREKHGLHGLSTVERTAYLNSEYVNSNAVEQLGRKSQKELWKQVNEANGPPRKLPRVLPNAWGKDKYGRNLAEYSIEKYEERSDKIDRYVVLKLESQTFRDQRSRALRKIIDPSTGEPYTLQPEDIEAEKTRRVEMAALKDELYGEKMGSYATDPAWDDVVPIPQTEPEGALASIAYPDDYAECKYKPTPYFLEERANHLK